MLTAEECGLRAESLERLAKDEREGFRRDAYRQMATFWRDSERLRASGETPARIVSTRSSSRKT